MDHSPKDRPPDLLTVEEVAAKLRVNPRTVYRAIEKKQLPAIRVGRLLRISKDALYTYIGRTTI